MLFKMSLRLRVFMHRTLDCRYVNRTACQPVFIPRRVAVGDEQRYVTGVGTRVVHDVMIVPSKDLCHPQQTARRVSVAPQKPVTRVDSLRHFNLYYF